MYEYFAIHTDQLPVEYRDRIGEVGVRRSVGDFLASMTDRLALEESGRLEGQAV